MNDKSENIEQEKEQKTPVDETGGFYFSSLLKVSDPNTNEILVEIRGDN